MFSIIHFEMFKPILFFIMIFIKTDDSYLGQLSNCSLCWLSNCSLRWCFLESIGSWCGYVVHPLLRFNGYWLRRRLYVTVSLTISSYCIEINVRILLDRSFKVTNALSVLKCSYTFKWVQHQISRRFYFSWGDFDRRHQNRRFNFVYYWIDGDDSIIRAIFQRQSVGSFIDGYSSMMVLLMVLLSIQRGCSSQGVHNWFKHNMGWRRQFHIRSGTVI